MRISMLTTGLLVLGLITACGKQTESETSEVKAEASGAAQASLAARAKLPTASASARIGGNVVAVGKYMVELLLHSEGMVEAMITDRAGKPIEAGGDVKLMVKAPGVGGARQEVKLDWDPERMRFSGRADKGVKLRGGPVDVELTAGGETAKGELATAAVVTGPRYGGELMAAGEYGAEVRTDADGEVEAHLWDAKLQPVTGSADLKVEANLEAGAKAGQTVALSWDAPTARFVGKAKLDAAVSPPALKLSVHAGGKVRVGRLARIALAGKVKHGGVVVAAGDYSVELVADTPELVQAFVMDAKGKAHARGDLKLHLALEGAPKLALAWHAPCACYQAKLAGNLDLQTKPIKVVIASKGRMHLGALASLKARAKADLKAKADLDAEADAHAKGGAKAGLKAAVKPPKVSAAGKASVGKGASARAGAKVSVKPPSVNLKVGKKKSAKAKGKAGFSLGTK